MPVNILEANRVIRKLGAQVYLLELLLVKFKFNSIQTKLVKTPVKRINNRQKNLNHRACGLTRSVTTSTDDKRRKIPVSTGAKTKRYYRAA